MKQKILSLICLTSLSGCATILSPGPSLLDVEIQEPANKCTVTISSIRSDFGVTEKVIKHSNNFELELNRGADYRISAKADGYYSEDLIIHRKIRPAFLANCCFAPLGGIITLIGMGIDFYSGNMWDHTDNNVTVQLEKIKKDDRRGMVMPIRISYRNGTTELIEVKMNKLPISKN